jgi:YD repeat-containing protein
MSVSLYRATCVVIWILVFAGALQAADFSLSISPTSQTVTAGNAPVTYTVTVTKSGGFSGTVNLTITGLPAGASGPFSPPSVAGSGTSTLTVTTLATTPAGTYPLTITGTSSSPSLTHTTSATLVVNSDFSLSAIPSSQTINVGFTAAYTVTVAGVGGFSGSVSFTASGIPAGTSASFAPTSLVGPGSTVMTLTTALTTPATSSTITVTGTSGSLVRTTTVTLVTTIPPQISYQYDRAGRLTQVTDQIGRTATYSYDSVGNLLANWPILVSCDHELLSILGSVGTGVTINGTGFSATANQNTVKFNGVTASVTSASTTQLVATVPTSATTGLIAVTSPSGSASSATSFTVTAAPSAPTISVVTPNAGASGTTITITGTNFSSTPSGNTVAFNGTTATVLTSTSTTLLVLVPNGLVSGHITVQTQGGQATSASDFYVLPVGVTASQLVSSQHPTIGSAGTMSFTAANQAGLIVFDGSAGQGVRLLTAGSFSGSVTYTGYNLDGTIRAVQKLDGYGAQEVGLGALPSAGTYTIAINAPSAGSLSFMIASVPTGSDFLLYSLPNPPQSDFAGQTFSIFLSSGTTFGSDVHLSVTSVVPTGPTGAFDQTAIVNPIPIARLSISAGPTIPAGTYTFTIQGTSGTLSHSTTVTWVYALIPSPWTDLDIGTVYKPGAATYTSSSSTFMVQGAGGTTTDALNYLYRPLSGDGSIIARVQPMQGEYSGTPEAGVMIRETLTNGASYVFVGFQSLTSALLQYRSTTGGSVSSVTGSALAIPSWLKLVRQGNTFTAYAATDGLTWVQVGSSVTFSMAASLYVGPAVWTNPSSGFTNALATANFDNISLGGTSDFVMTASPQIQTVSAPASPTFTIYVTPLSGFTGTVNLSATGLPPQITASFNPSAITGSGSSTLTLTVPAGVAFNAPFSITGTAGALTETIAATLAVLVPDFTISASPSTLNAQVGTARQYAVTVAGQSGFSDPVNLTITGLPTGTTATFTPTSITGTGTSTVTINVGSSSPAGTFTLHFIGATSTLTHSTTATLTIPKTDFSISATPPFGNVPAAGGSANYVVSVTPVTPDNGFNKTVTLTASGLPAGVTAAFSPASINTTGNSTLTITASAGAAVGTYPVTITGTSIDQSNNNPTHTASVAFAIGGSGSLPSPWSDQDIGAPGTAGSAAYATGSYYVQGSGTGIGGSSDSFHLLDQTWSGDGTFIVRVPTIQAGSSTGTVAGIMLRGSSAAGAPFAFVGLQPGANTAVFAYRASLGGTATQTNSNSVLPPYWLKLVRQGVTFSASSSMDGTSWASVGSTSFTMADPILVGLAVTAADPGNTMLSTATFDNWSQSGPAPDFALTYTPMGESTPAGGTTYYTVGVTALNSFTGTVNLAASGLPTGVTAAFTPASVTGSGTVVLTLTTSTSTPLGNSVPTVTGTSGSSTHTLWLPLSVTSGTALPQPWPDRDIGSDINVPGATALQQGSSSYGNGAFTILGRGNGTDASKPHFVYQMLNGNGRIIARLVGTSNVSTNSNNNDVGGLMIRESLTSTANFAFAAGNAQKARFEYQSPSGSSTGTTVSAPSGPYWLKLVRQSGTFTGSYSSDGLNWTQLGTVTMTIANTVYVGLAVTGEPTGPDMTAVMDGVSIVGGAADYVLTFGPSTAGQVNVLGGSTTYTVDVNALNSFTGTVSLGLSGLPAGVTAGAFSPATVTGSGSSTVTVTNGVLAAGTYPLTLAGTSGALSHSISLPLTAAVPDFSLSACSGITGTNSDTEYCTITLSAVGGFNSPVSFSVSGLGAGMTATFNPSTLTGSGSTTMTLSIAPGAGLDGSYTLTITGVGGGLTHTATTSVNLYPVGFLMSVSPTSRTVAHGSPTTYTVQVTNEGGFLSPTVSFSVSGVPSNATASFNPSSVNCSSTCTSTLTISTGNRTPTGTYTLTINGSSGTIFDAMQVTLIVN